MTRLIAVNERGTPIGEDHHRAVLTNREVDQLRALRDEDPKAWTFPRLAEHFSISHHHARKLYHRLRRAHAPDRWR